MCENGVAQQIAAVERLAGRGVCDEKSAHQRRLGEPEEHLLRVVERLELHVHVRGGAEERVDHETSGTEALTHRLAACFGARHRDEELPRGVDGRGRGRLCTARGGKERCSVFKRRNQARSRRRLSVPTDKKHPVGVRNDLARARSSSVVADRLRYQAEHNLTNGGHCKKNRRDPLLSVDANESLCRAKYDFADMMWLEAGS
eukprot:Amastigsp_a1137_20.p4 type:complete len:202 gc:universal Amastigsp_a1137_20:901-296(-)